MMFKHIYQVSPLPGIRDRERNNFIQQLARGCYLRKTHRPTELFCKPRVTAGSNDHLRMVCACCVNACVSTLVEPKGSVHYLEIFNPQSWPWIWKRSGNAVLLQVSEAHLVSRSCWLSHTPTQPSQTPMINTVTLRPSS